ncbi:Inner membrane ABC transporter permease protein YdcV [Paraburkholderia sediminicola]|uniref:Inner membrane ABC transporter permease protein YdcV n=1 Tax=Paraburkholderia sediminicola TaxID=458836 RepID=A0A6J5CXB3_9BURK|nr:ABC transporter permease [Paraburkholderia sediminicola]CAB3745585.1 Inner membrane ABC transporter permease protein YdcV [Paraburkholderia sediminicola]
MSNYNLSSFVMRRASNAALYGVASLVAFTLIAPLLVIIPMSFSGVQSFAFPPKGFSTQWYVNLFTNEAWYRGMFQSFGIGLVVTLFSLVLGTMAAQGLTKVKGFLNAATSSLLLSPMIIPAVVSGVGTYAVFLKWHLTGNYLGFILAHTALATPFVLTTVSASLKAFSKTLEYAAASCGATPTETFFLVTMPIISPGLASGALFAFMASFDEVVIASFLGGPDLKTLPVKMFNSVYVDSDPTLAAVSTVIIAITSIAIFMVMRFNRGRSSYAPA